MVPSDVMYLIHACCGTIDERLHFEKALGWSPPPRKLEERYFVIDYARIKLDAIKIHYRDVGMDNVIGLNVWLPIANSILGYLFELDIYDRWRKTPNENGKGNGKGFKLHRPSFTWNFEGFTMEFWLLEESAYGQISYKLMDWKQIYGYTRKTPHAPLQRGVPHSNPPFWLDEIILLTDERRDDEIFRRYRIPICPHSLTHLETMDTTRKRG